MRKLIKIGCGSITRLSSDGDLRSPSLDQILTFQVVLWVLLWFDINNNRIFCLILRKKYFWERENWVFFYNDITRLESVGFHAENPKCLFTAICGAISMTSKYYCNKNRWYRPARQANVWMLNYVCNCKSLFHIYILIFAVAPVSTRRYCIP